MSCLCGARSVAEGSRANKAQFSDVALRHIDEDEEIIEVGLPGVEGLGDSGELEGVEAVGAPDISDVYTTPEQLRDELLTLSLMPRSRWQTLLNLETIKVGCFPRW